MVARDGYNAPGRICHSPQLRPGNFLYCNKTRGIFFTTTPRAAHPRTIADPAKQRCIRPGRGRRLSRARGRRGVPAASVCRRFPVTGAAASVSAAAAASAARRPPPPTRTTGATCRSLRPPRRRWAQGRRRRPAVSASRRHSPWPPVRRRPAPSDERDPCARRPAVAIWTFILRVRPSPRATGRGREPRVARARKRIWPKVFGGFSRRTRDGRNAIANQSVFSQLRTRRNLPVGQTNKRRAIG